MNFYAPTLHGVVLDFFPRGACHCRRRGEVRKLLSRLIGRIRRHWPSTHITIRGDGHYGREEAMTWCENYGIDYIFGLSGNVVLDRLVYAAADDIRVRREPG